MIKSKRKFNKNKFFKIIKKWENIKNSLKKNNDNLQPRYK